MKEFLPYKLVVIKDKESIAQILSKREKLVKCSFAIRYQGWKFEKKNPIKHPPGNVTSVDCSTA